MNKLNLWICIYDVFCLLGMLKLTFFSNQLKPRGPRGPRGPNSPASPWRLAISTGTQPPQVEMICWGKGKTCVISMCYWKLGPLARKTAEISSFRTGSYHHTIVANLLSLFIPFFFCCKTPMALPWVAFSRLLYWSRKTLLRTSRHEQCWLSLAEAQADSIFAWTAEYIKANTQTSQTLMTSSLTTFRRL